MTDNVIRIRFHEDLARGDNPELGRLMNRMRYNM